MKRLFVLLISISLATCLFAVPSKMYKLVVKTTNSEHSYALYKQPEISFTKTDMVIKMDQEDVRFAKSDIVELLIDWDQYKVTFLDWDGDTLQSSMVNYGEMPVYTGITPTRESDAQHTYTFTGWSPELSVVTGAQSYTAQYESTLNQYEVNFYNWDGSVLQSTMVNYGELPAYEAATPIKPEDEHYFYTFFGWEPEITIVISEAKYTAIYEAVEKVVTSTENITIDTIKPRKVFMDGNLYIIIGKHIYSCQGHRIK